MSMPTWSKLDCYVISEEMDWMIIRPTGIIQAFFFMPDAD
jgi:hypothetical protein